MLDILSSNLIGDIWCFQLGLIGILVSVLTLLFASLCGMVEEEKTIHNSNDFIMMNRKVALSNSIKIYRKLNKYVMRMIVSLIILFVLSTVIRYLEINCIIKWTVIIDVLFTLIISFFCLSIMYKIYNLYQK